MGHMKQVTKSNVSATSGEVKLNINLEEGPLFEMSAVLRSLGHAPDIDHHEIVGVRPKRWLRETMFPCKNSSG